MLSSRWGCPLLITGIMEGNLKQLKERLSRVEENIRELEDRMPAHGVKPGMMAEICELEDERDAILAKMTDLKNS